MDADEQALLALLNSTPVTADGPVDLLDDEDYASTLARDLGGRGTGAEIRVLREVRDQLQDAVRAGLVPAGLDDALSGVVQRPLPLTQDGLRWELHGPAPRLPAARAVIAWAALASRRPGRLRACGNDECRLFLIDHTKGNTARWCSMSTCGNRMKARRHHSRTRGPSLDPSGGEQ